MYDENSGRGLMISNDSRLRKLGHKLPSPVRSVLQTFAAVLGRCDMRRSQREDFVR